MSNINYLKTDPSLSKNSGVFEIYESTDSHNIVDFDKWTLEFFIYSDIDSSTNKDDIPLVNMPLFFIDNISIENEILQGLVCFNNINNKDFQSFFDYSNYDSSYYDVNPYYFIMSKELLKDNTDIYTNISSSKQASFTKNYTIDDIITILAYSVLNHIGRNSNFFTKTEYESTVIGTDSKIADDPEYNNNIYGYTNVNELILPRYLLNAMYLSDIFINENPSESIYDESSMYNLSYLLYDYVEYRRVIKNFKIQSYLTKFTELNKEKIIFEQRYDKANPVKSYDDLYKLMPEHQKICKEIYEDTLIPFIKDSIKEFLTQGYNYSVIQNLFNIYFSPTNNAYIFQIANRIKKVDPANFNNKEWNHIAIEYSSQKSIVIFLNGNPIVGYNIDDFPYYVSPITGSLKNKFSTDVDSYFSPIKIYPKILDIILDSKTNKNDPLSEIKIAGVTTTSNDEYRTAIKNFLLSNNYLESIDIGFRILFSDQSDFTKLNFDNNTYTNKILFTTHKQNNNVFYTNIKLYSDIIYDSQNFNIQYPDEVPT